MGVNRADFQLSRKKIFGYEFIAFRRSAIAVFGFWFSHHMFVSGQSDLRGSGLFVCRWWLAIPLAIKVSPADALYKGQVRLTH